jgi:hypothetical protein
MFHSFRFKIAHSAVPSFQHETSYVISLSDLTLLPRIKGHVLIQCLGTSPLEDGLLLIEGSIFGQLLTEVIEKKIIINQCFWVFFTKKKPTFF